MLIDFSELKILNIGDCVTKGNFKIHSCYKNVVNFIPDNNLIKKHLIIPLSIVDSQISSGPNNIVLNNNKFFEIIKYIQITDKKIIMHFENTNMVFDISKLEIFDSSIDKSLEMELKRNFKNFNQESVFRKLKFIINILLEISPEKSLVFLLDSRRNKSEIKSKFQYNFEKKINEGIDLTLKSLKSKEISKIGISKIKGLGYGLTPSGDDFFVGMLIGLNFSSKILNVDYSKLINNLYSNVIGENIYSNTFIFYTMEGKLYKNFKNLILSIIEGQESDIYENTKLILNQGATSGTDTLVGFILTLKSIFDF